MSSLASDWQIIKDESRILWKTYPAGVKIMGKLLVVGFVVGSLVGLLVGSVL